MRGKGKKNRKQKSKRMKKYETLVNRNETGEK